MEKSANAFRTISEAANELDVPQHVLRFWETKFKQIKPMKRGGGRRFYRPQDVNLIKGIKYFLYGQGYTIKGVQKILASKGVVYTANAWRDDAEQEPIIQNDAKRINIPADVLMEKPPSMPARSALVGEASPAQFIPQQSNVIADNDRQERLMMEKNAKIKSILAELGEIKQIIKSAK